MIKISNLTRKCLLASFVLLGFNPLVSAFGQNAALSDVTIRYNSNGLGELSVDGQNILTSARPTIRQAVLAQGFRNRNEEPDSTMYNPDKRQFREASKTSFEDFFEPNSQRVNQLYEWGRLSVGYSAGPGRLNIDVKIKNTSDDTLEFLDIDLLTLKLGGEINVAVASTTTGFMRTNTNIEGHHMVRADHGRGRIVVASPDFEKSIKPRADAARGELRVGFSIGSPNGGRELADKVWDVNPIRPGEEVIFRLALRFSPDAKTSPFEMARDLLEAYSQTVPMIMDWPDRRPIGSLHVADGRRDGKNPRGWKQAIPLNENWDIHKDEDFFYFHNAVLAGASNAVQVARELGLQGLIIWQVEGMQEPGHAYYGEPRIVPYVAPEMDAIIDEFVEILLDAGLRVGFTLRPVIQFPFDPKIGDHTGALKGVVDWQAMREAAKRADWSVEFRNLAWVGSIPEQLRDVYDEAEAWSALVRLDNKISYAKERWGATLFYFDANTMYRPRTRGEEWKFVGRAISATIVEELQRRHPDCLIISEHQNFRYYASGAQYTQPPYFDQTVTPEDVRIAYPDAMSVIAAVGPDELFTGNNLNYYVNALVQGDTMLGHGWFPGHAVLFDRLFGQAALNIPFHVYIDGEGVITLNGEAVADLAAFEKKLAAMMPAGPAIPPRRVYVGYDTSLHYLWRVQPVLEAVFSAGGILAWTQPKRWETIRDDVERRERIRLTESLLSDEPTERPNL